jgi:HK97 family phage major capsid protein
MKIEELKARLGELNEQAQAIQATADAEKRDLTKEEAEQIDGITAEFESTEADIARRERLEGISAKVTDTTPAPRKVTPAAPTNAAPNAPPQRGAPAREPRDPRDRATNGWKSFGDFCNGVRAVAQGFDPDPRLINNALSTYSTEAVGADGGFAVPPEWRSQIMSLAMGEDSLMARTDQQTASGNTITFPVDETTAHQTSGGVQAYWDSEAATINQSKLALKELSIKLNRITSLVPVTDELLEDTNALGGYITKKAGEKIGFKINDAIVNGTGVGQPLGIMNAPCKVAVAAESSQTSTTIHGRNIVKMLARLPASSFGRSVWLINQDCLPQILTLGVEITKADGTVAGAGPMYMAPNGLMAGSPYGTLMGRPIVVTEACATLGTTGDIILADMSQYLTIVKSSGLKSDTSIHLFFDQNATAFRFVLRMNGQPWLSAAIARKNGSNTLSHFVALAAR